MKLPWPSFVPASHILYSDSLRNIGGGLHRSHVFNRASRNEVGAVRLMKVCIFCSHHLRLKQNLSLMTHMTVFTACHRISSLVLASGK